MSGKVESGDLVTVQSLVKEELNSLKVGDIVLCAVKGSQYLHLVTGIRKQGSDVISLQIGNNKGKLNGWTSAKNIFGKCVKVEP